MLRVQAEGKEQVDLVGLKDGRPVSYTVKLTSKGWDVLSETMTDFSLSRAEVDERLGLTEDDNNANRALERLVSRQRRAGQCL